MSRRKFLKQFSLVSLLPFLPRFQAQIYTFGAWLLPVGSDPLEASRFEFFFQTGTKSQHDSFFAAMGDYGNLWGRGFYGFSYPRSLTDQEIAGLRGLFEEGYDTRFPIIWR